MYFKKIVCDARHVIMLPKQYIGICSRVLHLSFVFLVNKKKYITIQNNEGRKITQYFYYYSEYFSVIHHILVLLIVV